jgi:hypothetical protein
LNDEGKLLKGGRIEWLPNTLNTSLCPHIKKIHLEKYMALAKACRWLIQLPQLVLQSQLQVTSKADGVQQA